jgi:hypothetical protein
MESKHTPGEWKVDNGKAGIDIINDDAAWIARMAPYESVENERQANARLIAAAPELYKELIAADKEICWMCKQLNPQHKDCTMCDDRKDRLAVIAKATGVSDG